MTPEEQILNQLKAQTAILTTIARQLEKMAQASAPASPNYRRRLSEYPQFNWSEIDAIPTAQDAQGVSEVEWNLHRFTRRAGSGKFGKAIWFSRPTGKDGDENLYARLITFKDGDAEPVPGDVVGQAQAAPPRPQLVTKAETIKPVDLYAPPPAKPVTNGAQRAAPITADPRAEFYKIGGDAVGQNRLNIDVFNHLVDKAKTSGFAAALEELHACLRNAVAA